jgi:hypothetical protein
MHLTEHTRLRQSKPLERGRNRSKPPKNALEILFLGSNIEISIQTLRYELMDQIVCEETAHEAKTGQHAHIWQVERRRRNAFGSVVSRAQMVA